MREVRVTPKQAAEADPQCWSAYEAVGIGHPASITGWEPFLMPAIDRILSCGKQVKIELPVMFESHMDKLFRMAEQWRDLPVGLIVNDLGTLYELKERGVEGTPLFLGRNVVYSLANCPWYEDILSGETPDHRLDWLQVNMANEEMARFLEEMNVQGLEVDLTPYMEPSVLFLRTRGFTVHGFEVNPLVSLSRAGHTRRLKAQEIADVSETAPIRLEPKHRWNRFEDSLVRISKTNREQLGTLLLFNQVIVQERTQTDIRFEVDSICEDIKFIISGMEQEEEG